MAKWFNERGWNAVFPHLPYHYSRTPRGFFNGELGITANVVHNSETLRQGVKELRQLMAILRASGSREFGVLGTSFGGWNGALLSFLERDFRFLSLIQPIVNVEHAIWKNPSAATMRRMLRERGITPSESRRHSHLTSPLHGVPLCGGDRTILTAGVYDTVAPASELASLKEMWPGSRIVTVRQEPLWICRPARDALGGRAASLERRSRLRVDLLRLSITAALSSLPSLHRGGSAGAHTRGTPSRRPAAA